MSTEWVQSLLSCKAPQPRHPISHTHVAAEQEHTFVQPSPYARGMDPEYYDRKAEAELKKVAAEMKKRAGYEAQAARKDDDAIRDDASASSTSSETTRRSKLRSAEGHRKKAVELRKKAAMAGSAASKAQMAANKAQADATAERQRRARKAAHAARREAAQQKRDADRARRIAEREARDRATTDRQLASDVSALGSETSLLSMRTARLEAALAESRRTAPAKVTVLLIAGTPEGGTQPLRLDREAREIDLKVRSSAFRDHIELRWMQATQVRDLIDALNRHTPDIVHFSGHGAESELLFEGPDGTPLALSGEQLATLLQTAPRRIRLRVFNACNSAAQAEAATEWAEFAIGMEQPIDDNAAKEWAGQFYGSLAAGQTVALAFAQATAHAEVLTSVASARQPRLFDNGSSDPEATVLVAPTQS
jgi:CHAT domain-containing protein